MDYNGPDSFSFTADDGQATSAPALVAITVNAPPTANAGADQGGNIGQALTFSSAACSDPDGTITFSSWNWGDNTADGCSGIGIATHTYANPGTYVVTLTVYDDGGATATDTLVVTVNAPPVANDQAVSVAEDGAVAVTLSGSDIDGDPLTYAVVTGPAHGTLTGAAPNLTYTPVADYNGPDSFTFTVNDGQSVSAAATVTVNVTPVNDQPVANGQAVSVAEDGAVAVTLTGSDVDGDPLTYAVTAGPAHGTLSGTAPDLTYTPAANYNGPDSFTFTANDGTVDSGAATVSITVTPVNDPPIANDDNRTVGEDSPWSLTVMMNDSDPDHDGILIAAVTQGAHGSVEIIPGDVRYSPALNYHGTDSFTYTISDNKGGTDTATVFVTITPSNDPPSFVMGQDQTVSEDAGPQTVAGWATGIADGDPEIVQELTFSATNDNPALFAAQPAIAPDGTLTFTPAANASGMATVTVSLTDDGTAGGPARWTPAKTFSIAVTAVNDVPVANAGADQSGNIGQVLSFSGAAPYDPDGSIVDYSWNWGDGTPVSSGPGSAATHAFAAAGTYTVSVTVRDDGGATAFDTATVTITAANVALNKTATASTSRSGYLPAMAVDGNTSTSWMSNKTGNQWLRVDLGAAATISNVKVRWQSGYHAKFFKVETSTNGSTWTSRYSTTSGTGGTTDVTFGPASARYVRVSCTKAHSTSYYGVLELEVYQ